MLEDGALFSERCSSRTAPPEGAETTFFCSVLTESGIAAVQGRSSSPSRPGYINDATPATTSRAVGRSNESGSRGGAVVVASPLNMSVTSRSWDDLHVSQHLTLLLGWFTFPNIWRPTRCSDTRTENLTHDLLLLQQLDDMIYLLVSLGRSCWLYIDRRSGGTKIAYLQRPKEVRKRRAHLGRVHAPDLGPPRVCEEEERGRVGDLLRRGPVRSWSSGAIVPDSRRPTAPALEIAMSHRGGGGGAIGGHAGRGGRGGGARPRTRRSLSGVLRRGWGQTLCSWSWQRRDERFLVLAETGERV